MVPDPKGNPGFGRATDSFVFDCGSGVSANYAAMGISASRMDKVFLATSRTRGAVARPEPTKYDDGDPSTLYGNPYAQIDTTEQILPGEDTFREDGY